MIVSVPSSARGLEPVTGASRKSMPRSLSRSPIARLALGAIVDMSTHSAPGASAVGGAVVAEQDRLDLGRVDDHRDHRRRRPPRPRPGVAAARRAVLGGERSAFSRVRFQTATSKPARARLAAIREPMIPSPRNATLAQPPSASPCPPPPGVSIRSRSPGSQRTRGLRRQLLAVQQVPARRARRRRRPRPGGAWRRRSVISE